MPTDQGIPVIRNIRASDVIRNIAGGERMSACVRVGACVRA